MKTRSDIILIVVLFLSLIMAVTVKAAYLEETPQDEDTREGEIYIPPPYVPPKYPPPIYPVPVYGSFYDFVRSLELASSQPYGYGDLRVYFIKGADFYIQIARDIITLDEAYRRGAIRISEYGGGSVSRVSISSFTGSYILIMAGEIVSGGRQTRTMVKDVLVPPYARNLVVDVYCIEEGRWEDTDTGFIPAKPMLDSSIRGKVFREEGQSSIWGGIKEEERSAEFHSDTHDLLELYKRRGKDRALERECGNIRGRIPSSAVGMVVTKNGRIIGAEAFCSHSLFLREFDKLFSSYYYSGAAWMYYNDISPSDVRRFLRNLERSSLTVDAGYDGAGSLYDVSINGYFGGALDFRGIIHLGLVN